MVAESRPSEIFTAMTSISALHRRNRQYPGPGFGHAMGSAQKVDPRRVRVRHRCLPPALAHLPTHPRVDRGLPEHRGRHPGRQPSARTPNRLGHSEIRAYHPPLPHPSRSRPPPRSSQLPVDPLPHDLRDAHLKIRADSAHQIEPTRVHVARYAELTKA
jgi:hypothetical protein